jgi:nitric oxide reductase NorD protein
LRREAKRVEREVDSSPFSIGSQPLASSQSNHIQSFSGRVRDYLARLRSKTAALWFGWRGWSRFSYYSFELQLPFLKAFLKVWSRVGPTELARWTSCAVRLAKADEEVASEFLREGTDILLKLAPSLRLLLIRTLTNITNIVGGESLQDGYRAAMTIASGTTDYEVVAEVMNAANHIGTESLGYASIFLQSVAEIIPCSYDANPFQRALLANTLNVTEKLTSKFAVDLFEAMAPFIKTARAEGQSANATLLCERLLEAAEAFTQEDEESALSFVLCGVEFVPLNALRVIEKWILLCRRFVETEHRRLNEPGLIENWTALCKQFGFGEINQTAPPASSDLSNNLAWRSGRPFVVFSKNAHGPTKALVALAQQGGDATEVCGVVLDNTVEVLQRNAISAINCYRTSPKLLGSISLNSYREWVKHGLETFSDPEQLAAYFAAESRASQDAINESADSLQLHEVQPVLSRYVRMLTGRELPLEARTEKYDVIEPASGESVVLPPAISGLKDRQERFHLYKALTAQGAGQIEFGTYESGTERLQSLGTELIKKFPRLPSPKLNGNTDWHTLISLFPQTTIARRLFTILENARIEFLLRQKYKGLRHDLEFARHERRRTRPNDQYVMKYEPLLELLFIEALGNRDLIDEGNFEPGDENKEWLKKVHEVLDEHIYQSNSNVGNTVRACLTLYSYLNPAPPESSMPWEDPNVESEQNHNSEKKEQKRQRNNGSGEQIGTGKAANEDQAPALETEAKPNVESQSESAPAEQEASTPEELKAKNTYFYDEWDYRISDYRTQWCRVVESDWRAGDLIFAKRTRAAYRGVLSQVRYQFQLLRPVGLRRVRGQTDGDEFDLDAVTDLVIDRHAHQTPSERIYSERQHRERDVAVCFLLDMSGSTNAKLQTKKHVLDVEKEALLLMSDALEAVGDSYAIYGFSSGWRNTTNVYRFKDFEEANTDQVERRIGNAHSLVNTHLGVAIRHATFRLNQQPSATRLLIVLSDARPADENYGGRYAREDTRVALAEARASDVTCFFITFDQGEHQADLEQMLEGTNFTIIDDVMSLPERMPGIYRRLTT